MSKNKKPAPPEKPWSVPVTVDEVPETGRAVTLTADADVRAAVARAASIKGVPRLEASFDLSRRGRDGLHVAGRVSASVEQTCVVTLEPITNEIDETFDLVFLPPRAPAAGKSTKIRGAGESEGEMVPVEAEGLASDEFETLHDGTIDLGVLATEFLLLGINPYPRKEGAVFEAPATPADPSAHPFAALAALKKEH